MDEAVSLQLEGLWICIVVQLQSTKLNEMEGSEEFSGEKANEFRNIRFNRKTTKTF